ncbi:hypothetical protein [Actinomadura sp. WMMA1423]|uniref:hypothetical protein n=1 Tax=Actinomadura sp. WMMA1423 TaxID=2591108 RepID=UPI00143DB911|nr:hypothetical protein [Actinomadura sp. WMMA1423]
MRTVDRTRTESARFTVTAPTEVDGELAVDAGPAEVAGLLVGRGFTTSEALAVMARANERGEAMLSETEMVDVRLPHPDDVQVASKWTAVNEFRAAYARVLTAPAWDPDEVDAAEEEAARWETAAVRVAADAAERVGLSAEVWLLRRDREHKKYWRWL